MWEVDDEAVQVVRWIFKMCIKGLGPAQIARQLRSENIPIPTAYAQSKGRGGARTFKSPTRWSEQTVNKILERIEYVGHTADFKTHNKSYKNKKHIENSKEGWLIFENTHEPIMSQHDFDLLQEMRKNKRKVQKCGEVNPYSGKISDERFAQMSTNYDGEQQQLKQTVSELKTFIEATEQKTADVSNFIRLVRNYTYINVLTPEIIH
ncbi:MAG: recombinase family protein [Oscillospiraceae bacterium]|nr:recombinase family protein [Oscillospiraceae bacterium]